MTDKIYTFKENSFTTQKHVLKINGLAIPLQEKFKQTYDKLTKGIDKRKFEIERNKFIDLENRISADEEYLNSIQDKKEITRVNGVIKKNKAEYKKLKNEINSNPEFVEIVNKEVENTDKSFQSVLNDTKLITLFLIGDASKDIEGYLIGDLDKLDFTDWEILNFISEIVADFFTDYSKMKLKYRK
jgi:hypothetical protein